MTLVRLRGLRNNSAILATLVIFLFTLTLTLYVCWCGRRCSGGTEVTVTGENVDAAAQPYISVTVVVTSFNHTDHDDDNDPTTVTSEVLYNNSNLKQQQQQQRSSHRPHTPPGAATWGVTLSTRHFYVGIRTQRHYVQT